MHIHKTTSPSRALDSVADSQAVSPENPYARAAIKEGHPLPDYSTENVEAEDGAGSYTRGVK